MTNKNIAIGIFVIFIFLIVIYLSNSKSSTQNTGYTNINTQPIQNTAPEKSWTLFTSKNSTFDITEVDKRIEGYQSQTECIEKGISFTGSGGSFECGFNCRYRAEYREEICGKVCGRNGCRD